MYFTKYPHPANFTYAESFSSTDGKLVAGGREFEATLHSFEGDVYHLQIRNSKLWSGNKCIDPLQAPAPSERQRLKIDEEFGLHLLGVDGKPILVSADRQAFGVCGGASIFRFELTGYTRFYGMGEKTFVRVELGGIRTKFWNTDVLGDFHDAQTVASETDPPYFSTPYLAMRIGDEYVGLLLDNPYPTFLSTPGCDDTRVFEQWQRTGDYINLGSEDGEPNLWVIYAKSLPELTRKLQKLVGVTPLPPIWSLGYHQSRWGYEGASDLLALDKQFAEHQIPCDGLWMDLEYMDGFRIFKTSETAFPGGAKVAADEIAKNGRRIVPILDPGVKFEPGYSVYDEGHEKGLFCHNAEGREYIGIVWPGETVFPDFSQAQTRKWWSEKVVGFANEGFGATWVDMNDPSTGPVDPTGMRFNKGKDPHQAYHNQYALGMQMATREGFLKARPNERPFVLSRSGFTGTSKYSAIWTGDNFSNYFYLGISIPTAIGMSLSGIPFAGPDLGGFCGDCTESLMIDWVKTDFLFPFFRNHSVKGSRSQEPFAFPESTMRIVRRYIRLRYKLLPYLYNLFVQQETEGDPMLRPLFYEFEEKGLDRINDQFMIGPSILQAPFVVEKGKVRQVVLPGTEPWFDASYDKWLEPGEHMARRHDETTPLYIRAGAVIAMQPGTPVDNTKDLVHPHFHIFVPSDWTGESTTLYSADDGISFDYQKGARSTLEIHLKAENGAIAITTKLLAAGYEQVEPTFVFHGSPKIVRIDGKEPVLSGARMVLTGKTLAVKVAK